MEIELGTSKNGSKTLNIFVGILHVIGPTLDRSLPVWLTCVIS